MIIIDHVNIQGFKDAIRGARNPLNSWEKSDSEYQNGSYKVGENDKKLLHTLSSAGTDHGKFMRMITVSCDITAPLYWWKQFDTYRIGVEKNSCSTMHRIHSKEFVLSDFSIEHLPEFDMAVIEGTIEALNYHRDRYNETKDKNEWYCMVQLLPDSYNQKRTVMMSYASIKNMYHARKDHKLTEWHEFCHLVENLPLFEEIISE